MRLIVYLSIGFILYVDFCVGSGVGILVVYLVSVYWDLLIVYTEIPKVFWALGILFYLSFVLGGYGVTYYTGLGDHLGIECNPFVTARIRKVFIPSILVWYVY